MAASNDLPFTPVEVLMFGNFRRLLETAGRRVRRL